MNNARQTFWYAPSRFGMGTAGSFLAWSAIEAWLRPVGILETPFMRLATVLAVPISGAFVMTGIFAFWWRLRQHASKRPLRIASRYLVGSGILCVVVGLSASVLAAELLASNDVDSRLSLLILYAMPFVVVEALVRRPQGRSAAAVVMAG